MRVKECVKSECNIVMILIDILDYYIKLLDLISASFTLYIKNNYDGTKHRIFTYWVFFYCISTVCISEYTAYIYEFFS